ncbi:hypothetical protein ACSQ67_001382 [Phaseolus vulgaris]
MSDAALHSERNAQFRSLNLSLGDGSFTGVAILHIAHSRASSSLLGLSLPDSVKASALTRLHAPDANAFRSAVYAVNKASDVLSDYITAIADELESLLSSSAHEL